MQMQVGCCTLEENKHVGASRMLGFQADDSRMLDFSTKETCWCQSDAGLS